MRNNTKNRNKKQEKINEKDSWQTPPKALIPLLPYLEKDYPIWECAVGKGNISRFLHMKGYEILGTDILTGTDFLHHKPRIEDFGYIVTNPPFSKMNEFIERCYWFWHNTLKPFALLLPDYAIETTPRQKLFKDYGLQIIYFDKRICFYNQDGELQKNPEFASAWFTWGLNLPDQINFATLIKDLDQFQLKD